METPDDKTVVFHLNQPDSAILSKLTYSSMAVLDSAVVKENGGTDAEDASSTDTAQALSDSDQRRNRYCMCCQAILRMKKSVLEKNPELLG
ncbi:MAG: hypothetical protein ACLUD2_04430 [Clostridium sp.]